MLNQLFELRGQKSDFVVVRTWRRRCALVHVVRVLRDEVCSVTLHNDIK
jgi:hypothetical protein